MCCRYRPMNIILSRTVWTALLLVIVPGLSLKGAPEEPLASTNRLRTAPVTVKVRQPPVIKAVKAQLVTVSVWDERFSVQHEGKVYQFKMAQGGILFRKGKPTSLHYFRVGQDVMIEVLEHTNGRWDLLTASALPLSKVQKHECVNDCEYCAQKLAEADSKAKAEKESRKLARAEAKAKKQAEKAAREQAKAEVKAQKNADKLARKQREAEAEEQKDAQAKANKQPRDLAKAEAKAQKNADKVARKQREAEAEKQKDAQAKADKQSRELAKAEAKAKKQAEKDAREQAKAEAKAQKNADKVARKQREAEAEAAKKSGKVSPVPQEPAGSKE